MSRTALIAGQGGLPRAVANALGRADVPWFACHLEGFVPEGVGQSRGFRIEHLGSFIAGLKDDGVERVVFAGRVARPPLDAEAVDAATMPLVPRMMQAIRSGDDAALRAVISFFEEAGLAVVGVQDVAPELVDLPEIGEPDEGHRADIARAREVHAAMGSADVGQACVVVAGQVLAVEALPGTDWMLASLAPPPPAPPRPSTGGLFGGDLFGGAADWLSGPGLPAGLPDFPRPPGGVLLKAPKPGQDRRIDLPTIGPETAQRAAKAQLAGIAVEAGGVLVIDRDEVAQIARGAGLFLHAYTP
ncbi:LpxI family protein [Jannaschia aquimarina]|uniref:Uncharacterized protein n=1 Tax=Jannaschia aquimarina TaxID=935700 RepID=A0A0D1EE78_9RHOB|nr:UDP-2,3-diacylglucosamine diphosphatase LpxI [Jannaschia aquimarina]KIT16004.1 hypothetical protein jaqu_22740 [Jannaschia aquimarina]SNS99846.1 hypothetical protein SAMN05421775_104185 [Jannaschia aquimarina]